MHTLFSILTFCILGWSTDGPDTIANPLSPDVSGQILRLEEDLRVSGTQGQDTHVWVGMEVRVAVNAAGHMFVVEPSQNRILEFDPTGRFVRNIGGKGEGPGEFQTLKQFQILKDGSAVAVELGGRTAFTYYDAQMNFLRKDVVAGGEKVMASIEFSPTGEQFAGIYSQLDLGRGKQTTAYAIFNRQLEILLPVKTDEIPMPDFQRASEPAFWAEFLAGNLKTALLGSGVMAFSPQGEVFTAVSTHYRVAKWDAGMKEKTWVMTKEYAPIPWTDTEIEAMVAPMEEAIKANLPPQFAQLINRRVVEKAIELAEFPKHKNPIAGIIPMEDGGFLVIHDVRLQKGDAVADIFSRDARYLGSLVHEGLQQTGVVKMIFRNGFAYSVVSDKEENLNLVRYKYALTEK